MKTTFIIKQLVAMTSLLFMFAFVKAQNAVTTHAGSTQGYLDATGSSARFKAPTGICISPDNLYLYVADYSGHRIRRITVSTKAVTTIAGNGLNGFLDSTGTAAQFSYPSGICISDDGTTLYVSDNGNSRIRKIVLSTQKVSTIAGNGSFSFQDHANGLQASFNGPTDVKIAGDSALYVSDTENHLIRKIDLNTTEVSTVAGMLNVGGFQDGVGTNAAFRLPKGIAITADKTTLFVADGNNLIRKIILSDKTVSTVAGSGVSGYSDNTDGSQASFNSPAGVAIVPGNPNILFVADNGNHRIRKVNLATSAVTTVAGNGSVPPASTFADNSAGMNARFFYPTNLIVNPTGEDIFIADQGNFRVRRVKTDLNLVSRDINLSETAPLNLYPNPCGQEITVSGLQNECSAIEIVNASGQIVKRVKIEDEVSSLKLDLTGVQPGFYLLKLFGSNVEQKKFIVTNQ